MDLPVYYEVILDTNKLANLTDVLRTSKVGKSPCFIQIHEENVDKARDIVDQIYKSFRELGINGKIPYPTYLIMKRPIHHPYFVVLDSDKKLPRHFRCKPKLPNPKESTYLQKINILSRRVSNLGMDGETDLVKAYADSAKKIYMLTKVGLFYKGLLDGLNRLEKPKQGKASDQQQQQKKSGT